MNTGFKKMTVNDPNKLKTFIEGTTGSIVAILNVSSIIDNIPIHHMKRICQELKKALNKCFSLIF